MKVRIFKITFFIFLSLALFSACKLFKTDVKIESKVVPEFYSDNSSSQKNSTDISWKTYFADEYLIALIDTALKKNQELNIFLQEIEISKNEVKTRKGEYLPFVNFGTSSGTDKAGKYTRFGALEDQLEIKPGSRFPEPYSDFAFGLNSTWEIDVWKKLRNAKKSALMRYLATVEGKNFLITNLISEIAETYFELVTLDNFLDLIDRNIEIQSNAYKIVKQQKESAKLTQLAVNRFEAQLLNTQNLQYEVKQKIVEAENKLNFLTGRFSGKILRNNDVFYSNQFDSIQVGLPSQLLSNRPDIKQAEYKLTASKLDVKVAKARFYPTLGISAGIGYNAFNPAFLVHPESMIFNLAGDLVAPLINRNAIKAAYKTSTSQQIQAVYEYEQTILKAYLDVQNNLSKLNNLSLSYETKNKEVEILMQSVSIANNLFNSARADYTEVLLTQREALESKKDIMEIKMNLLLAKVQIYRALGGGWK